MASTFSQIHIQTVFAVNGRLNLITPDFKEALHKYITGVVTKKNQKLIQVNGMSDHLYLDWITTSDGVIRSGQRYQS